MGRGYRGTDNADEIRAIADANEQIHIFAEAGDDVIRMDFSGDLSAAQPHTAVNGHHVYGGAGADEFHFDNLAQIFNSETRIVGRIDDLNASQDSIFVEGTRINLANPQDSVRLNDGTTVDVRIVQYEIPNPSGGEALSPQQFLLIGDSIMYAIEGARLDPTSPTGEETHFFEWTGNPDDLKTVDFRDENNYVPASAFDPTDIEKRYDAGRLNLTTSDKNDWIYFNKLGSGSGNRIEAKAGDDVVNAGQGNDTVDAGSGDDLVAGGLDSDEVSGNSGDDTLWGGSEDDTIFGNSGRDVLYGGDDDDILNGGGGSDKLDGGFGDDIYYVDKYHGPEQLGDTVHEGADQGHDKVFSTVDFSLRGHTQHVEDLELLGSQDAFATGNSQHNRIVGNDGSNLINGAWGNDTLIGGRGNDTLRDDDGKDLMIGEEGDDTYYLDNKGDDIRERAGEGRDRVVSYIDIALEDLSRHLEDLTLTGNHGLSGKGNLKDNLILGNSGDNHVEGLQGNDILHGNQGDDSLHGQAGHDTLYGGSGDDLVQGGAGDDNLTGGLGDDTIFGDDGDDFISAGDGIDEVTGGPGDDTLLGSAGDDTLTGNGDDDVFVMRPGGSDDKITDFNNGAGPSSGDKIDISAFGLSFDQIGFEEQSDGLRVRFGSDSILLQTLDAPALDRSDFVGLIDNIAETGTLTLNHTTQTVKLESSYDNPVVIAHVATENGGQPVNVRVSEVGGDELTLQLQEPNHLNGTHVDETVNYMVVEAGSWVLPDGTLMEAGTMDSDKLSSQGFETVAFDAEFDAAPSVLSQVQSFNGGDFVTTRQRGADADSFQFTMQEEEAKNDGGHVTESLGWIAVEPGSGSAGDFSWRAGSTSGVTDATASVGLEASMADDAHVIAALSSFDGGDTAWARGNGSTDVAFDISVEEDTSRDRETGHIPETVDYFAFDEAGVLGAYDYDFFV